MSRKVVEYLSWVYTMLSTPVKRRHQWVETIFDGLRSYRNSKRDGAHATYLSDALLDSNTWEIIGFVPNVSYVRVDYPKGFEGDDSMIENIFVHPWGAPTLLCKHRRLPVAIMVGPGMRWNDSVLSELKENGDVENPIGFTG